MTNKLILVLIFYLITFLDLFSQSTIEKQIITFGKRIKNPVRIEVINNGKEISFFALKNSSYPYQLKITFKKLKNLSPYIGTRNFVLMSGKTALFKLSRVKENLPHDYSYNFSYSIGKPTRNTDSDVPYLIPLKKGIRVKTKNDLFYVQAGDTLYSMRKGYVAMLQNGSSNVDQVKENSSLEVQHLDGTIAVYENMTTLKWLKPMKNIYPGQPIGVAVHDGFTFRSNVYKFLGEGRLQRVNIFYALGQKKLLFDKLNEIEINHPDFVIDLELTKKELKKKKKGELY